jgi:hypothetical protein
MFILSFLLFSAIHIQGQDYIKIYRSSHEIDLFFLEDGFFNPAGGYGIVGAELNPAALGRSPNVQFLTTFSFPGVSATDVDTFSFEVETDEGNLTNFGDVLPGSRVYGGYHALGGINFIGFAKRFGMFGVGLSYSSGYKLGVEASLSGSVYGDIQADEVFEFTHDDFSEIPDGDTVRVRPLFKGAITLDNDVPLRVQYSDVPIFFGTGLNVGPLGFGVGLKFQNCRILGEGAFSTHIDSLVIEVRDTNVFDSDGDEWLIRNFSAALDFDKDLVTGEIFSSGLSTMHPVFSVGSIIDFPGMKISWGFDFGGNYELAGDYNWNFSWISDIDSFTVDTTTYMNNISDSLISGRAIITVDSATWDSDSESEIGYTLSFSGSSFNFGFEIEPINLGITGKLAFPADYSFSQIGLYTYAPIPVPVIDVKLGLAANIIILSGYELTDLDWRIVPSASLGLSFSYERDYLKFYLPVKYDVSHIASVILDKILEEEEDVSFDIGRSTNIWDNLAFGFGISVKM